MCHLSTKDQYICQSNQGIAEAVTCLLGGAQFSSCPFYHPSSSRCCFRPTRKAAVCAGNFSDSNGISDYFKRQKRSHSTEPVPAVSVITNVFSPLQTMHAHVGFCHLTHVFGTATRGPKVDPPDSRLEGGTQSVCDLDNPTLYAM